MAEERADSLDELTEQDLEAANPEPLPDREAMSIITPHVTNPGITLPVEPSK